MIDIDQSIDILLKEDYMSILVYWLGAQARLFFFFFLLFRATPTAYGGPQVRGRVGAAAASQHHSHVGSEPRL